MMQKFGQNPLGQKDGWGAGGSKPLSFSDPTYQGAFAANPNLVKDVSCRVSREKMGD